MRIFTIIKRLILDPEQVYQLIANHTTDMVCLHDSENTIRFATESSVDVMGYPPLRLMGRKLTDFLTEDFVNEMDFATLRRFFDRPGGRIRYQVRHGLSGLRWLESTFTALHSNDNDQYALLSTSRDITESVQLTEDLMQALSAERELSKLKTNLYSVASHEFKTPLAVIQANIEMLKVKQTPKLLDSGLGAMEEEVDRLNAMIGDMLELKKMTAGQRTFNPAPLYLDQLVQDILGEKRSKENQSRQYLFHTEGEAFPIEADYSLVRYILTNFISNAEKFSPEEEPVEVHIHYKADKAILMVEDHGIGIPEEEQASIFQSFYRAKNVEHISGTGVGLAIVAEFVKLHHGRVHVESKPEEGSTFIVHLPKQLTL